jgi:hypothetical protein
MDGAQAVSAAAHAIAKMKSLIFVALCRIVVGIIH